MDSNTGAKATSRASFSRMVAVYRPQLQSFLYRFTASREDAEDLTQETFLKAWNKFETFKAQSSLKTWLFAIASNLAKDHLRAKKRWPSHAQDACKELVRSSPDIQHQLHSIAQTSHAGRYDIKEHIDFCFTCIMKTLPIEQHLVIMLAEIYSFKVKEIAEIMDLSPAIIKHHLHKARSDLRDIFEQRCALINKRGICHQCSELNGFRNNKAETHRIVAEMELVKAAQAGEKSRLFTIRTELVRAIDPLNAAGTELHDFLLKHTARAVDADK